ncbi:glycosyltransferase family 4 protein [Nocardioides sp. YIM 152315]|uniref:glycosyltransferase family 4 protein n=1 Tax=Nocardioides sp. YIM 152315 TaxID=3031760 RepID=UPI0023D97A8F|nr:glycosyltransferase family 4 protein [Nocardioides sp. YIM 152315]MDF1605231.1 glycosyltransferase family 4 protein [Nocardioides sp. YIM 152315]
MITHVVRPPEIDDPARPSGGNVYDRRVIAGLGATEHTCTATVPDGATTVVDGLLSGPDLLTEARRLRLVVLVHTPRWEAWEGPVLRAAAAVITTSRWTRDRLVARYDLARAFVAEPGVDPAPLAPGSADGSALLSVGAVTPAKGYDVLVAALDRLDDLAWTCRGVGSTSVEPGFATGLGGAVRLTGPMTAAELDAAYAEADLLVLASRAETYGMVVTEALARGLPVVASDVGGVREALGHGGVLVPPGDAGALAEALRRWLTDARHRAALRAAARSRRGTLAGWERTVALVGDALEAVR